MKQNISALMDGELFDDEVGTLLDGLKRSPDSHKEWHTYHLIGDALRQPDHIQTNISAALHQRLQSEPTALSPRDSTSRNVRWFALSAAASTAALALVGWMSVQVAPESSQQMAMRQPSEVRPASFPTSQRLNNYLMAHQEFSPSIEVQGTASYIRTVAGQ